MHKYACIVVTYYPDKQTIENISKLSSLVKFLVVIDNTPESITIPDRSNMLLITNGSNRGLATALNQGIHIAGTRGFENIFLLDQDSHVPSNFFMEMMEFKIRVDKCHGDCALYVPNVYDRNSGTFCRFPEIKKYFFRHYTFKKTSEYIIKKGLIAITSGSLLSYSKHLTIGPLRDEYFIDFIDNEYCLRISRNNLKVSVNCDVVLDHAIGHRENKKLLGISLKPNNHAPFRRYFIARNGIITSLLYINNFPSYSFLVCLRLFHEAFTILLFEDQKNKKLSALFSGIVAGLNEFIAPSLRDYRPKP